MENNVMPPVVLKPGKERAIRNRHHWIFSGAVQTLPPFEDGDILEVFSAKKELLGRAFFNRKSKIIGRMICFDSSPPKEAIASHIDKALELRKELFKDGQTTAYRLINAEGDGIPGLIVDRYDDVLVIQISTLGIEKLRDWLIDSLIDKIKPRAIYEKSLLPVRKEEGLQERQGIIHGTAESIAAVSILENGLRFIVDIPMGQKTGFFLDHRKMRAQIRDMVKGKKVLNCFAYTGGFSIYAMAGGASRVDTVDISEAALESARRNTAINGFDPAQHGFYAADIFQYLHDHPLDYDFIILDPPAFAKKQKDIIAACRGYKEINRIAMLKMPRRSFLLTCSCSYHVDMTLFQQVVFQAAAESDKNGRIIGRHRVAEDHPINIFHPEGDYLKSLLLYLD